MDASFLCWDFTDSTLKTRPREQQTNNTEPPQLKNNAKNIRLSSQFSCLPEVHLLCYFHSGGFLNVLRSLHTESEIFICVFFFFFVFVILSYQNACDGCENAENRTWSEFFYDGRMFQRQCINMIDTMWGRIYFLACEHFWRKFRTQCAMTFSDKILRRMGSMGSAEMF